METILPPARSSGRSIAWLLWAIRLLALLAAGVSGYLLYVTLAEGAAPPGCGPMSDCERVLDSRWSTWFGIPVSALAAGVYVAMLGATFAAGAGSTPGVKRAGWVVLLALALAAAGAAGWFAWVQFFEVRRTCPYCMAVHAAGLLVGLLAVIAFALAARHHGAPGGPSPFGAARPTVAAGLALAGVATLAGGQVAYEPPAPPPRIYRAQIGRRTLELDQAELPFVGWAKAPKSAIVINDYTCHHCRDMHAILDRARARYGQRFSVIVVTVPLAAKCNPTIRRQAPVHRNACELATLALAVWRAKPEAFERMDAFLYAWPSGGANERIPHQPDAARRFAVELVGEAALERAMRGPWIARRIRDNIDLNVQAGPGGFPKLIFPDKSVSLDPNDEQGVFRVLEKELGLKPGA